MGFASDSGRESYEHFRDTLIYHNSCKLQNSKQRAGLFTNDKTLMTTWNWISALNIFFKGSVRAKMKRGIDLRLKIFDGDGY